MMGNFWGGIGGWGMGLGWIWMILIWGLVIAGIVALGGWLIAPDARTGSAPETPLQILQKRYARGDIGREEFEQKKRDLN
jgi:putative membrane protein